MSTTGKIVTALIFLAAFVLGATAESWNPYAQATGNAGQIVDDTATPDPLPTIAPCDSDDGSGPRPCYWDAATRGNGQGTSFTINADGTQS